MERDKFLVSYSPSINDYRMICIGGKAERIKMQQNIDAWGSDEVILEISEEKYNEIRSDMEIKYVLNCNPFKL